jgi:hypothetical protein
VATLKNYIFPASGSFNWITLFGRSIILLNHLLSKECISVLVFPKLQKYQLPSVLQFVSTKKPQTKTLAIVRVLFFFIFIYVVLKRNSLIKIYLLLTYNKFFFCVNMICKTIMFVSVTCGERGILTPRVYFS